MKTTWGTVLLGPTIRYQRGKDDYESDRLPLEAFVRRDEKLAPRDHAGDLQPGSSGIRAKLCPPGQAFADFMIQRDAVYPRVIQVAGIDSPGSRRRSRSAPGCRSCSSDSAGCDC
jgi:hypothetical protein